MAVRVIERRGGLAQPARRRRPGDGLPPAQAIGDRAGREVLHDHVGQAVALADVEDGDDVGVVGQPRAGPRLAHEPPPGALLLRVGRVEDLHGDQAAEQLVLRSPDGGHAARCDMPDHPVAIGQGNASGGGRHPGRRYPTAFAAPLVAHGEGLSQLREGSRLRAQPFALHGRDQAPVRAEPAEGAHPRRPGPAAGVRLPPLPEARQGRQGGLAAAGRRGPRAAASSVSDPSLVRFRAVLQSALAHLESRREEVNDLNVFPVADGDTGDNMALTLRACVEQLDRLAALAGERTIDDIGRDEIVDSVARAALLGARGNSGVILSQLIRGAAQELISRPGELVDPVLVGAAMARAAQRAYDSVRDPAEGTMLTVAREMASRIASELAHMPRTRLAPDATDQDQDGMLADILERALDTGQESVKRGPELLPILRESGVVDAGGYGVTIIFAG